jgi:hypothetical protein
MSWNDATVSLCHPQPAFRSLDYEDETGRRSGAKLLRAHTPHGTATNGARAAGSDERYGGKVVKSDERYGTIPSQRTENVTKDYRGVTKRDASLQLRGSLPTTK